MHTRILKRKVLELLAGNHLEENLEQICRIPARKAVNPLFSFFCHRDEIIRWRAVVAMGAVVAGLAESDMEGARVIMRRLMWSLNDESGGIGWGAPEAMAEIMARHKLLAQEYACILVSYLREDGNYIEHEMLQRGVLWGVGRLAGVRPCLLRDAARLLVPYLESKDATVRGLAAMGAGILTDPVAVPLLKGLAADDTRIRIFTGTHLAQYSIRRLALEALSSVHP